MRRAETLLLPGNHVVRLCAACLLAAVVGASAESSRQSVSPQWQKGVTFTVLDGHRSNLLSSRAEKSMDYLRNKVHVEWIALNPFAYQRQVDSPWLQFGGDPPDEHLRHAIRQAHELGLKVMLKPHIWLSAQSADHWRGTIAMGTEDDWNQWFDNYRRFILYYAAIAEQEEVDVLCVGVELARTALEREQDWRRVIAEVRNRYSGPLVYAANWWGEYEHVQFWDALDYIGINAFFPLSDVPQPNLASLRRNAEKVAGEIALLHQTSGKPVIFTEVGFKSISGASVRPWEWPRRFEPSVSLEEQAGCYQAILETFWDKPWFYGMYWWKWFSDLNHGGALHPGFTPRGKPAERILSTWFRKPNIPTPAHSPRSLPDD